MAAAAEAMQVSMLIRMLLRTSADTFFFGAIIAEFGLQTNPAPQTNIDKIPMVTFSVKWRPKRRVASVALCGSIFIATLSPLLAVSTGLWFSSMLAMRPMSMPPWLGMHNGVPTCTWNHDHLQNKVYHTTLIKFCT